MRLVLTVGGLPISAGRFLEGGCEQGGPQYDPRPRDRLAVTDEGC